jgi:hypothetical protein
MPIAAQCGSCQKKFKAPDNAAGKKAKCPQCGGVIQIPALEAPKPAASDDHSVAEEAPAAAAAPAAPAADTSGCPACGAELAAKAVLCVDCGFDLRTGKKFEATPSPEPEPGPEPDELAEPRKKKQKKKKRKKKRGGETRQAVKFIRGCAASFGSALIGSILWFAAAYYWHLELPIVAWVLGGLAGVGMMLGYGVEDVLAGLAAAGMALLAIFATRVTIFAVVFADIIDIGLAFQLGLRTLAWPWWNTLILLFSCATAYQVGSGGGWIED